MAELLGGNDLLLFAGLTFIGVLLMLESLYLMWRSRHGAEARRLRQRLSSFYERRSSVSPTVIKERLTSELPTLDRLLRALPRMRVMEHLIQQAGLRWTVTRLVLSSVVLGAFAGLSVYEFLRVGLTTSLLIAGLGAALPVLYVRRVRRKRLERMEAQLPDALDLMTRALRAGHAFTSALKMVAEEMADPLAGEFRIVHDEVNYGVSMQQALTNLTERVPLTDLRYFVVSVLIQRESGGNLTEVFGNLSRLVRQRGKLAARIRVLSSEGRMSAWIMSCLPFFLGGILYAVDPEFMGPMLTDPIGQSMLSYLLSMMAVGVVVLQRLVRIRY